MFARAFESYVLDKVTAQGGVSDYLVASGKSAFTPADLEKVDDELMRELIRDTLDRYPQGTEREVINAQFDKLVAELKTEETPEGIALYRRDDSPAATGFSKPEARQAIEKEFGQACSQASPGRR